MITKYIKRLKPILIILLIALAAFFVYQFSLKYIYENKILKEIITRLEADSRIAEVIVTDVRYDKATGKALTTIKFLEYDVKNRPLKPKYFTFSGNVIQFQSLVIRFDELYVKKADMLRGRSAYLFWKVFMLDGKNTEIYDLVKVNEVPQGYKIERGRNVFEERLWRNFWRYAIGVKEAKNMGIKNAQIEAPGTRFVAGMVYALKIEHDGGMRIDASPIPDILKGEKIIN
ncbi:MAG: hypothetical protein Q8O30_07730 [Candidatus Omnitrophota bacterium]|nr:hypothetical protein [Candidatus Omnitrophota bacterium]